MIKSPEKTEIIAALNSVKTTQPCLLMCKLLDICIQEAQETLETTQPEMLAYHQGVVSQCRYLRGVIEKGVVGSGGN